MVKFRGMSLDGWLRITASNSPTTSSRSKAQSGLNWIIKIQGINLLCKYLADSNMISCSCLCLMDSRAVRHLLYFLQMFVFKEYQNTEVSAVFQALVEVWLPPHWAGQLQGVPVKAGCHRQQPKPTPSRGRQGR